MTMSHGMSDVAVKHFDAKWKCTTIKMAKQHTLNLPAVSCVIDEMYGDCTAATLYASCSSYEQVVKAFPAIIEFLSLNGRISCMFTIKTYKDNVKAAKKALDCFPIIGLHIQRGNRSPEEGYYQLTGILKIPSPYVKGKYDRHAIDCAELKHDHADWKEVAADNAKYGFQL